jgi:organic radical activating enzyme
MHIFGSLGGNFHLCCHAEFQASTTIVGTHEQPLKDIWNSDTYKKVRLDFLDNKPPVDCITACYQKEIKGSTSNRLQVNKRFNKHSNLQDKTNKDGSVDNTPTYLDIRFGNLCNFKCRMCGPLSSTSWYSDSITPQNAIIDYFSENDNFWKDIPNFIPNLEEVYFAGGEPFVQEGHYKMLCTLIDSGYAKNISISYNTNLSYSKFKKYDLKNLWSNFKKVSLWPSIDGYGKRVEYSRKGLSWSKFENNANIFKDNITTISSVISIYSITSMPELILWCKRNNFDFYGTTLIDPPELKVTCLPKKAKQDIVSLYKKFIMDNKDTLSIHDLEQIKSWLVFMNSEDTSSLLPIFKKEQERLDILRKESFINTFTEFASWYKNI